MCAVLQAGRNCWRIESANRFALLIDGADYYSAVATAIRRAQRSVALLAWDFDTRTHLVEHGPDQHTGPLRQFFRDVVDHNPNLRIAILAWDFPLLFANVRDPNLMQNQDPFAHPRICFHLDNNHPPGASHHQKIVAVDGQLAFAGGMDFAGGRWDTSEHRAQDPRRGYAPTHDVQALVDGAAAAALADIVRDRWNSAAQPPLPPPEPASDPWPENLPADLTNVAVAISRTNPLTSCREIETLHLDLIAAAREFLYMENQYLTSTVIVDALSRRLQEPEGPEIILVLPLNNSGWLEDHTIEALRYRKIRELRMADRFGHLRICYPTVEDIGTESIVVHSKIMFVDDHLFRIGSANLTDRSMALDTECDLAVEAADEHQQRGIARLRNRLIGEHLDLSPDQVEACLANDRSLIRLIDACSGQRRCLRSLPDDGGATQILSDKLVDPAQPLTPAFVMKTVGASVARSGWFWIGTGVVAGLAAAILLRRYLTASRPPLLPATADGPTRRAPERLFEQNSSEPGYPN